jgi:hypothetical protein
MRVNETGVAYCNPGHLPFTYGFCPNEKSWKRELKRLGCEQSYLTTQGSCATFTKDGCINVLVTLREDTDKFHPEETIGLLAHEAIHVWQAIRDHIGEEAPSFEFEAYTFQAIFQELLSAYVKLRRPDMFRKSRKTR